MNPCKLAFPPSLSLPPPSINFLPSSADHEDEEYDGLDPEIELEMEAFIEEIEEHLMLQDFDPELRQKAKPGGGK